MPNFVGFEVPFSSNQLVIWLLGYLGFKACFTWREASVEESQGEAFRGYCCGSNTHIYAQVEGKWFHKPSEMVEVEGPRGWCRTSRTIEDQSAWERPIVTPAAVFFDCELCLVERHYSRMKAYSERCDLAMKLRHLLDGEVLAAAIRIVRSRRSDTHQHD